MAILFFEGLPRAGKSYEAMVTQIIPFLQKGREVVAYIEGLNFERIAEAAELPLETVQTLLFPLTREDMRPREVIEGGKKVIKDGTWIEKVRDNALHVFDEAQNWWPNRHKASPELTQFITEHGHRGMTLLLMGQDVKDVLALWRRRIDQKFDFLKLTALGSSNRYRVTVYKGQGHDEYVKVGDRICKYDSRYFGTYASHVSDDTDTATYTDGRVNVLKSGFVRFGLPVVVVLGVWGAYSATQFFSPDRIQKKPPASAESSAPVKPSSGASVPVVPSVPSAQPAPARSEPLSPQESLLEDLSSRGRIRLAGLIAHADRVNGYIEWLDGDTRVVERMTLDQLRQLGVSVMLVGQAARLSLGEWVRVATMWPLEPLGRVSESRTAAMRPAEGFGPSFSVSFSDDSPISPKDPPAVASSAPLVVSPGMH